MNTFDVILDSISPSGDKVENMITVEAKNKDQAVSIAKSQVYSNRSYLDFYLSRNCFSSVSGEPEYGD